MIQDRGWLERNTPNIALPGPPIVIFIADDLRKRFFLSCSSIESLIDSPN